MPDMVAMRFVTKGPIPDYAPMALHPGYGRIDWRDLPKKRAPVGALR
jgi:hypothetical protein